MVSILRTGWLVLSGEGWGGGPPPPPGLGGGADGLWGHDPADQPKRCTATGLHLALQHQLLPLPDAHARLRRTRRRHPRLQAPRRRRPRAKRQAARRGAATGGPDGVQLLPLILKCSVSRSRRRRAFRTISSWAVEDAGAGHPTTTNGMASASAAIPAAPVNISLTM